MARAPHTDASLLPRDARMADPFSEPTRLHLGATCVEVARMSYVEGFVAPVPTNKKDAYVESVKRSAKVFMEYGATRVVECWGDDVPAGKVTDFMRAVQAKDDETVVFSWVIWPDKATRDAGGQKMMTDPRMKMEDMPLDGKRMIFGGFVPLFDTDELRKR